MLRRWPSPVFNSDGGGSAGGAAAGSAAAAGGEGGGTPAAGAAGSPPTAPAGLETFWDAEKGALKVEDLAKTVGELQTLKTEHEARQAAVPAKPEDVKLALPEGFQIPEGVEVKFDEADPAVAEFRQFVVDNKLDQATASKLLALEAKRTIDRRTAELAGYEAEAKAERAKLGDNADTRIAAIEGALKANLSGDQYEALRPFVTNAAAVEAIETLIAKVGGGGIPGAGANTGEGVRPDLASRLFPSMKKAS